MKIGVSGGEGMGDALKEERLGGRETEEEVFIRLAGV